MILNIAFSEIDVYLPQVSLGLVSTEKGTAIAKPMFVVVFCKIRLRLTLCYRPTGSDVPTPTANDKIDTIKSSSQVIDQNIKATLFLSISRYRPALGFVSDLYLCMFSIPFSFQPQ